jgi:hypothetical protein
MAVALPDVVTRYFEADAQRDHDSIVTLFTDESVVEDEGETHQGVDAIRAWRAGPASKYEYTTELFRAERPAPAQCVVTGRIEGNFPGGSADLTWRFTLAGDHIQHLRIGS